MRIEIGDEAEVTVTINGEAVSVRAKLIDQAPGERVFEILEDAVPPKSWGEHQKGFKQGETLRVAFKTN